MNLSIEALERENAALKAANAELERENAALKTTNIGLEKHAEFMQTIFDQLSEGVVATNLEGEFLLSNPTAQKIVGMGPTDTTAPEEWSDTYGTFYSDKVTPMPLDKLPLYRAMRGEKTDDVDIFIRNPYRPDGIWISVSGRPLLDETDNVKGGVIVLRDVSKIKEVESELAMVNTELQTQKDLIETIFDSISEGIIVADTDAKYIMFNAAAKRMAGSNAEGVFIKEASEIFGLFDPNDRSLFPVDQLPLARALQGEHVDNAEVLVRNPQLPQGRNVIVSAYPILNEKGEVTSAVSTIRDISVLKKIEQQLQARNNQLIEQAQFLQSVFDSMNDGVIVADKEGHIILANPKARQIIGESLEKPIHDESSEHHEYFHLDGVTPFPIEELPINQAVKGISTDDVEFFIRNSKIPEGVYLNANGRPLWDSEGNQAGGVSVFHDVTHKIRGAEELANAFMQGRLEIMDTILHNIGNAINSVSIGLDTIHQYLQKDKLLPRLIALAKAIDEHQEDLSDYVKNDPQGQQIPAFILALSHDFKAAKRESRRTVRRVRKRTRHIVDIIRTQNSYQQVKAVHKDINIAHIISDAIKILQDSIDKRQIQIEIDCENAPEEIRVQESQFHQMLVNLIKNSIEAIDDLAELGAGNAPRIQIRAYIVDDFLTIDVTDNGIGITAGNIQRIFGAGYTTKTSGSGLGLHSSANFVISMGGEIQPISEGRGKGTTMRVIFRYASIQPTNGGTQTWEGTR